MKEAISKLLKKNLQNSLCVDCLNEIGNSDNVSIIKGICMPKDHLYDVYKTRYEIQVNVTHSEVEGYESLLANMSTYTKPKIQIVEVSSSLHWYGIFCDTEIQDFIGILKGQKG